MSAPEPRIGCSGFSYPHWRGGVFYPPRWPVKRELEFYARQFDTVELNSPFYRLPSAATFRRWAAGTPPGFEFAVKASRYITHMLHLRGAAPALRTFLQRARQLGPKLGPVLFQFPSSWGVHLDRLEAFLPALPTRYYFAFEFRHAAWFTPPVYAALQRRSAALCWAVHPSLPPPPLVATAAFVYLRLHAGRGRDGGFTPAELRHWAKVLSQQRATGRAVYAYFNNDSRGCAVRNARSLRRLLSNHQHRRRA